MLREPRPIAVQPVWIWILARVGVVSADTALPGFGGSIIWSGTGAISTPSSCRTSGLSADCPPSNDIPSARGWDLTGTGALDEEVVSTVLDEIRSTAIPAAFW